MATSPNISLVCPPTPSIRLTKTPLNICPNANRSLSLSSSRSSMSGSLAIKCSKNSGNANGNGRFEKKSNGCLFRDMVSSWIEELLKIEEVDKFLSGLADAMGKDKKELEQKEIDNKKMKQQIIHLKTRLVEIEKCQKKLLEAKALVEDVFKL